VNSRKAAEGNVNTNGLKKRKSLTYFALLQNHILANLPCPFSSVLHYVFLRRFRWVDGENGEVRWPPICHSLNWDFPCRLSSCHTKWKCPNGL